MLYVILFLIIIIVTRYIISGQLEKQIFECYPEDIDLVQLAEQQGTRPIKFSLGDSELVGQWVEYSYNAPSVLLMHGNGETNSDWLKLQLFLKDRGYSSFVFDYAGFGDSKGTPSVKELNNNAITAWDVFKHIAPHSSKRIVVAHSLGTGVLISAIQYFSTTPDRIVLHGSFSSIRELVVVFKRLPANFSWIMPNIWNTKNKIRDVNHPDLRIIHSRDDERVPYQMSEVIASNNTNAKLIVLDNFGHNTLYKKPSMDIWKHILD